MARRVESRMGAVPRERSVPILDSTQVCAPAKDAITSFFAARAAGESIAGSTTQST